jgi:hypothetical protein
VGKNNCTFVDNTPPKLSCPQSYVIELVDRQDSYAVNFNETRRRINATDDSGDVHVSFIPDKATIAIGTFENVTVVATDKSGNKATCHFQVSVQATPCVDWELKPPVNGALNCLPGDRGLQCIATCNPGYRFTDGEPVKTFSCDAKTPWTPTSVVPDCVSESKTQIYVSEKSVTNSKHLKFRLVTFPGSANLTTSPQSITFRQ